MLRGIAKSTNAAVATCLFRTGMACIYLGAVLTHRGEATFGEWWNKAINIALKPSGQDSVLSQTASEDEPRLQVCTVQLSEWECDYCGVGYILPSGRCDHCNVLHPPTSDQETE